MGLSHFSWSDSADDTSLCIAPQRRLQYSCQFRIPKGNVWTKCRVSMWGVSMQSCKAVRLTSCHTHTDLLPSDNLEMTFPSSRRLRLMNVPSLKRTPSVPAVLALSEPARSTKFCTGRATVWHTNYCGSNHWLMAHQCSHFHYPVLTALLLFICLARTTLNVEGEDGVWPWATLIELSLTNTPIFYSM